ncbi:MAG: hypothetical protein QM724_04585 [Flavobacteriales bacterium]
MQGRMRELSATSAYALHISTTASGRPLPDETYIRTHAWEQVGLDTVPCTFVHLEAVPGLVPYRSFLLAFGHPQDGRDRTVHIDDPEGAFGGDRVFRFPPGAFGSLQQLITDTLSPR